MSGDRISLKALRWHCETANSGHWFCWRCWLSRIRWRQWRLWDD